MKSIRAFIALPLPPPVTAVLSDLSRELAAGVADKAVRWVKPEAVHLTLRFLGETAVNHLPALTAGLDRIAAAKAPFPLRLGPLGCFPNPRRPRVIWIGLEDGVAQATQLKQAIDTMLVPLGWEAESRPFQPHLTLGRVKEGRGLLPLPWGELPAAAVWPAESVQLIESQLRPSGAVYTTRHSSPFSNVKREA